MTLVAEALARAFDRHQTGGYDEAEALYRHILVLDPGRAEALHRCGLLVAQLGRLEEADRLLERATVADPLDAAAQANHGRLLRALGRPEEAIRRFHRALALCPALLEAQEGLGHAGRERGDAAASAVGFGRAAACGAGPATVHHWGVALEAAGQPERAAVVYRRAAALDPLSGAPPERLAMLLHRLGRGAEAAGWFRRVLVLHPTHGVSLRGLAELSRSGVWAARAGPRSS